MDTPLVLDILASISMDLNLFSQGRAGIEKREWWRWSESLLAAFFPIPYSSFPIPDLPPPIPRYPDTPILVPED
jgi:hypothetical protein